jgi:hypothetical protein
MRPVANDWAPRHDPVEFGYPLVRGSYAHASCWAVAPSAARGDRRLLGSREDPSVPRPPEVFARGQLVQARSDRSGNDHPHRDLARMRNITPLAVVAGGSTARLPAPPQPASARRA